MATPPDFSEADKSAQRKRKKFRSAWISFVSRVLAQLVGATATIALGLLVLQKYQATGAGGPEPMRVDAAGSVASLPAPRRTRGENAPTAIAVLPLQDFSGDRPTAVADAMTEAIITALTQTEGLRVISRTSSMHYKGVGRPLREIARELEVDWVVEGSIISAGGRVRLIAQLIDAETDEHIWAQSYDRRATDFLSLQSDLAPIIARDVREALLGHGRFIDERAGAEISSASRTQ